MTIPAQSATAYNLWMRALRQAAGITLRQAASLIGVSVPYLSDVERGVRATMTYERAMAADHLYGSGHMVLAESVRARMPWLDDKQVEDVCKIITR